MRTFVLVLALAVGLGPSGSTQAQTPEESEATKSDSSNSPPDFRLLRQEEDWRGWTGEDDLLASLKNIRVTPDGSVGLTIGGEARTYARWYQNERWGDGPDRDGYLLQRLMLHGSVESGAGADTHVRAFAQLKSGIIRGRDGPVYPPDQDRLGVNQAFLEIRSKLEGRALAVRVGRQELHYGTGRMIAVRKGPNVRLGFDAVLGRYREGPWRVDAFAAKPNATPPGILDNGWISGRTLWGVHASRRQKTTEYSFYYFGTRRRPSPTQKGLHATRHTVGGRRHGSFWAIRYDLEGAVQLGGYRLHRTASRAAETGRIRAWTIAGRLSYRLQRPRPLSTVGVMVDWTSGDANDADTHGTFAAPYPSGRYTGAGSRLGPGNLINATPFFVAGPYFGFRLKLKTHFFWRSVPTDGIYAIWGAPLRPDPGTDKRLVGVMPETVLSWHFGRHVRTAVELSTFRTGPVLRQSVSGDDMIHVGLRTSYVF